MHDSQKTAPTFLVYASGWVFLGGIAFAWVIGAGGIHLLRLFGQPVAASLVAGAGALMTMGLQWVLIGSWRRWNTPKALSPDREPLQLPPDRRHRIQTGQGT